MAGKDQATPFENQFWGNAQKYGEGNLRDRWALLGAIIGSDEELVIVRHPIDGLMEGAKPGATVASQTGLHIQILDTRGPQGLKVSKKRNASNVVAGDFIRLYDIDSNGNEIATGGAGSTGVWADGSLAELKEDMKDLTDAQIKKILDKAKVYRFHFVNDEEKIVFVGPEAAEFHTLTGWQDGRTIAPGTIAGIALRLVQWVWKNVDKRLKAIELKLAEDAPKT